MFHISISFALKTSVKVLPLISQVRLFHNKLSWSKIELISCWVDGAGGRYITFPFLNSCGISIKPR